MKLSNTARSVAEISPQASIFVPMTLPSAKLPDYVVIDSKSQWHVSALLATALESMTLPSRLKLQDGSRETIDQLTSALNINGNQNIAKLRMSIDQEKSVNGNHRLDPQTQGGDSRAPLQERRVANTHADEYEGEPNTLDMEFFPPETGEQVRGQRNAKKPHVFGQAEYNRSDEEKNTNDANEIDEGYERARRRAAGLPIIHKYVKHFSFPKMSAFGLVLAGPRASRMLQLFAYFSRTSMSLAEAYFYLSNETYRTTTPLPFPLLDSFPHIFARASSSSSSLGVSTSLTTDTTVALRIKNLQHVVSRAISFDEREALSNTLGELTEAYEEGWDSGSDDDDD